MQRSALRTQDKAPRAARAQLQTLALSDRYDEARAHVLSDAAACVVAETMALRAGAAHAIWQAFTPEQRRATERMPPPHGPARPEMPAAPVLQS